MKLGGKKADQRAKQKEDGIWSHKRTTRVEYGAQNEMGGRKELCGEGEEMTERRDRTGTSERLWVGSGLFGERGGKGETR